MEIGSQVVTKPHNSSPFADGARGEVKRVISATLVTVQMDCYPSTPTSAPISSSTA